jgi:hypothetical protein
MLILLMFYRSDCVRDPFALVVEMSIDGTSVVRL